MPDEKDARINATVVAIISEVLSRPLRVMAYLCDASDGRQVARQKLFLKWYRDALSPDLEMRAIRILLDDEDDQTSAVLGGLLYRLDFPHRDLLEQELVQRAAIIIGEKFGEGL